MVEDGGYNPVHVEARGYPKGTRVEDYITNFKGENGHLGYWPSGIAMEGGGGYHKQTPVGKCIPTRRPAWVLNREGDWDGDTGTELGAGDN